MATRNEEQKAIRAYRAAMKAFSAAEKKSNEADHAAMVARENRFKAERASQDARNNMLRVLGGV